MSSHLLLALASFSWTCYWHAWSYLVIGLMIPPATIGHQSSLPLSWIAEPQKYLFPKIPGLFYGTSLPPWVEVLENILVSFIPHTTWERLFYTVSSDSAALLLLNHIECGPRLKARLPREFAASPKQHLEEWGASFDVLLFFDIYLSVSAVYSP